ncbi:MAG: hypothetical protein K8L91_19830 [Anaerolineae bacterium]|nr:hypothetical protein [Anaerolineae bacterium]
MTRLKSFAYLKSAITLVSAVFIASLLLLQSFQISGDGLSYYAYLRSLVFDHDLDFTNEFTDYNPAHHATPDPNLKTEVGKVGNPYAVGPAILWSPFVLIVHLAAEITGQEVTGYEQGYAAAIAFSTNVYALLGLLALYDLLRRFFEVGPTLAAIAAVFWGTAAINYLYFEPAYGHIISAAWVMIFVAIYQHYRDTRTRRILIYSGIAAGLMILTRWQSALFLLFLLFDTLDQLHQRRREGSVPPPLQKPDPNTPPINEPPRHIITSLLWIGLLCALIFLPQLIIWHHLYGQWFTVPMGSSFIQWQPKVWWEILVAPRNGLFTWTPLVLVSLLGLPLLYRRDRLLTLSLTGIMIAQWLLNGSIVDWWGGAAFGGRRFIECSVIFALGLAALLQQRRSRKIVYMGVILGIGWNITLWTQYAIGSQAIQKMSNLLDIYAGQFTDGLPNLPRLLGRSTWLDWFIRSGLADAHVENVAKALVWLILLVSLLFIPFFQRKHAA